LIAICWQVAHAQTVKGLRLVDENFQLLALPLLFLVCRKYHHGTLKFPDNVFSTNVFSG